MKAKIAIILPVILIGLLVPVSQTDCNIGVVSSSGECCPQIEAFKVDDPWVCPADNPGGGRTRVNYTVKFWRQDELCTPSEELTMSITNVKDNADSHTLKWDNPGTGVYEGTEELVVTKDSEYKLTVTTGTSEVCKEITKTLTISVVDDGDFHEMTCSGVLDDPMLCELDCGHVPFGTGVLVDHLENPNNFGVTVLKGLGASEYLMPYKSGNAFSGVEASDNWSVALKPKTDCKAAGGGEQQLPILIYLKCQRP